MPSYVVTGASAGLGFEFLRQLSEIPDSIVIGLVRDKAVADRKIEELKRDNLHILQADIADYDALKKAVYDTQRLTGRGVDYIIANAAYVSTYSAWLNLGGLGEDPDALRDDLDASFRINVIGNINLFNLFVPLLQKGSVKKVISISTGMADLDNTIRSDNALAAPYSISKVALNMAVAKFSAQYGKEGILFMSISPGLVNTKGNVEMSEEQKSRVSGFVANALKRYPNWTGPISPETSVKAVMSVVDKASVANGDGGSFVSHWGNQEWL